MLSAPVAAGSLVARYAVGRASHVRPLGGAVLLAGTIWCARAWARRHGIATAVVLVGTHTVAFASSHRLAPRIGAWPSVLTAAAASAASATAIADRRR